MSALRHLLATLFALVVLLGTSSLALRWETVASPVYYATVTLHGGRPPVMGGLRQNWSGDFEILDSRGKVLLRFVPENVAMMSVARQNALAAPWRLVVGLVAALALAAASWWLALRALRPTTPPRARRSAAATSGTPNAAARKAVSAPAHMRKA